MGPKFGKKDKLGLGKCHLGKYLYFAIFINNFSCYIVQGHQELSGKRDENKSF